MGLNISDDCRNTLQRTSLLWGESTALLLLVGLTAGCTSREPLPPAAAASETAAAPAKPVPTLSPLVGEITATESAEGHTHLQLTPVPELQEGDVIRVMAEGRVVATALVTKVDASSASALVTGLSDRTRPVATGDRATRLAPAELLPTPGSPVAAVAAVSAAAHATVPAIAPTAETAPEPATAHTAAETTAGEHPAPTHEPAAAHPVDAHPMDAHAADAHATDAHPTAASPAEKIMTPAAAAVAGAGAVAAAAVSVGETPAAAPALDPEMRARLTAERAYFDLATRILRLPAAGPELHDLQERLRDELAEVELLP